MAVNFDDDITSRIERQRKQQMAASMGKTVEQMEQDSEYFDEIKAIEVQDRMDSEAEDDADADAGAAETAANEAAYAERPWYKLKESGITAGGNPYDDPDFGKPAEEDDWAQKVADELGEGDSFRETGKKVQAGFDTGRFDYDAKKKLAGYEEMYPESYKDSVRSDEMSGLQREREVYQGSTFDKLRKRKQEIQQKVASQEMTPAEAEESFENYRQGLFREINLEKAGGFSGEFQGVGVMPPQEQPPEAPPEEVPKVAPLEGQEEVDNIIANLDQDQAGFLPEEMAAAGAQADIQRDENDPAVKDFKKLNEKAVAGDPKALKDRADIFKGMPKEEKAMAKEELGNYYIGPGGYAINLDKLDERKEQFQREAKFSMLQYIPDHAKPQMLASWGFIDQEDVDNSPDDPKVQAEHIKAASALAVQTMIKEGLISVANINSDGTFRNTKELTRSREEIQKGLYQNNTDLATMNNAVKKEITGMNIDWNRVKLDADKVMHMSDNELKKWGIQFGGDMEMEKMHMLRDHFKKEMKFKYSKIRGIEKFQTAQLSQQNEQFKLTHGLKTTDQQQGWLVKQHTMMLQKAKQLLDNGNPTAAMMVYKAAGTDIEIDIPGFWKQQAKTSAYNNPKVSAAFSAMGYSGTGLSTGINRFVAEQSRVEQMFKKPGRNDETGLNNIEDWVDRNKNNKIYSGKLGEPWAKMTPQAQDEYPGGYPAWENEMVAKAIHYEMGRSKVWGGVYKTINAGQINITGSDETENKTGDVPSKETVKEPEAVATPPVTGAPLAEVEKRIMNTIGYGKKHVSKNRKQSEQKSVSREDALTKSLKEGEKRAKQFLQGKTEGRKAKYENMRQVVDHFRENPEKLKGHGDHFQYYILTQMTGTAGK